MPDHADAATQRNPAQYAGRDDRQLEALPDHRLPRSHARSQDYASQCTDQAVDGENDDLGAVHVDTRQQRGFLVAADGHGVAPIGGVVEQPAEEYEAGNGDQDRHRHAIHLAIAKDEEVLVGNADGLAVGENVRQAAHDLHGCQSRDQGIDAQLGDHNAVDQTHDQPERQGCRDTQKYAVGVADDDTGDHPGTSQHRTDREVEVPGRQAKEHGAGSDTYSGNRQAQTAHVQRRHEVIDEHGTQQENPHGGQEHHPVIGETTQVHALTGSLQAGFGRHTHLFFIVHGQGPIVSRACEAEPIAGVATRQPRRD